MAEAESPKGQKRVTIDDPGWYAPEGGQGRFAAFPLGAGEHDPLVVVVEYGAGVRIGAHSHASDYWSMVVAGEVEITRRLEEVGSIRLVRAGTAYGPLVVGTDGATVVEVFADRTAFTAPAYLVEAERLAAGGSPMPALAAQAIAATWPSSNSNT